MKNDPKDVMQAMYASFSQLAKDGDVATHVATYYAPSAKYHPVEEAAPIRGTVELVRWHERWFDAWDELQAHAEEVLLTKKWWSRQSQFGPGRPPRARRLRPSRPTVRVDRQPGTSER